MDYYSKASVIAEETISTVRTTVAFSQQKNVSKIYESKLETAKLTGIKSSILSGMSMGTMNFFIYSTYGLAFWYGSTLIAKGEATSGDVCILCCLIRHIQCIQHIQTKFVYLIGS